MEKAKILEQLIKRQGYSLKAFAEKCGIPYTTLYGIMKNGVGRASVDNVIQICKTLGITQCYSNMQNPRHYGRRA